MPSIVRPNSIRVQVSDMQLPGESWIDLPYVISVLINWSSEEHSGEMEVEVANTSRLPKLHPFQRIRVLNLDLGIVMFIGRLMQLKPQFSGPLGSLQGRAYKWTLYARDYMYALADNFVQADKMHEIIPLQPAPDATYVPVYDESGPQMEPPGQGPSDRYTIIRDLVTKLTGNDVPRSVTLVAGDPGRPVRRNYLRTPQTTVLEAVFQLAREHPWDDIPSGIGYTFRVAPPGRLSLGAEFEYFRRGAVEWDPTQSFGWSAPPSPSVVPILSFQSEQEGFNVYSRAKVLGRGLASFTAQTMVAPGMEDEWDPSQNKFLVTREAAAHDDVLVEFTEMQKRAQAHLVTSPPTYRGPAIGWISTQSIPVNAAGIMPVPGDVIRLDPPPPGLEDPVTGNRFVIDQWRYEWPQGLCTYVLNRRPRASGPTTLRELANRGLAILSKVKNYYDSWWIKPLAPDVVLRHGLGVVPRYVQVYAAAGDDDLASNNPPSTVMVLNRYYDAGEGVMAGMQVTSLTSQEISIRFEDNLAWSAVRGRMLTISGGDAVRVVMEP